MLAALDAMHLGTFSAGEVLTAEKVRELQARLAQAFTLPPMVVEQFEPVPRRLSLEDEWKERRHRWGKTMARLRMSPAKKNAEHLPHVAECRRTARGCGRTR
jgi:hypothetical protein